MTLRFRSSWFAVLAAPVLLSSGMVEQARAQSPEELEQIEAALPDKAPAKAASPRRVLVFSTTKGFRHGSIPHGIKALELMGTKTGAFTTSATEDIGAFEQDVLKDFDAVVMLNTTGELFTDPALRENLLGFVQGGKGLVGIHAAADCCYDWRGYGEMLGGYFDGHPWNAGTTVTVRIEKPEHPVMAAFPERDFVVQDEIYQLKDPFSRKKLNVLAGLNTAKTDMTVAGIKRTDGDFAVSWVQNYGMGRVFYCSLGHNPHIYWNPVVLGHYLAGIQFALGDLEADATPDLPATADSLVRAFPGVFADATETTYTGSRGEQARMKTLLNQSAQYPEVRREFARQMARWLRDNAAASTETLNARQFIGRKLGEIATAGIVNDLAPLLRHENPHEAEIARKTLEKIAGPEAGAVLIAALAEVDADQRIGIINSLGERREAQAVGVLTELMESDDRRVGGAAAAALGKIATLRAADALARASRTATGPFHAEIVDAWLRCADQLLADGHADKALAAYEAVYNAPLPSRMRVPALIGYVNNTGKIGRTAALRELLSGDPQMRAAAAGLVLQMESPDVTAELVSLLRVTPEERRVAVLGILGARGDRSALATVLGSASEKSEEVRVAAIQALGRLGDSSVVPLLAEIAGTSKSVREQESARGSLATLSPVNVDTAVLAGLTMRHKGRPAREGAAIRAELVKAVAARRIANGVPALLKSARDKNATVSSESFKALAEMAEAEHAPALVKLLTATESARARREAEKAVLVALRRIEDEEARPEPLLKALAKADDAEAAASVIRVLSKFGGQRSLDALRQAKQNADDEVVHDAAVRALIEFSTADALEDVRKIARESDNDVHRVLAARGFARMVAMATERSQREILADAREALDLAGSSEDRRLVLGELAAVRQPGMLEIIVPEFDNEDVREDAMAAVVRLAETEGLVAPHDTTATLERVIQETASEETRKKATELAGRLGKEYDFIPVWRVAGPYEPTADAQLVELLEQAFAPEDVTTSGLNWKVITSGTNAAKPEMVDLEKALGGKDRVAYLRVRVWSPEERAARLEMGSDDGVRAWLNGALIHSAGSVRPYRAGADKLDINLVQGWNHLMLKVTQGSGRWAASARITSPEGEMIKGLELDARSVENTALFVHPGMADDESTTATAAEPAGGN